MERPGMHGRGEAPHLDAYRSWCRLCTVRKVSCSMAREPSAQAMQIFVPPVVPPGSRLMWATLESTSAISPRKAPALECRLRRPVAHAMHRNSPTPTRNSLVVLEVLIWQVKQRWTSCKD